MPAGGDLHPASSARFAAMYLPYLVLLSCLAGAMIAFLTIPVVKALDHIGNEMIQ